MELNIEQFNPKKAELVTLAEQYKNLTITGVDDKDGYEAVKSAEKKLQQTRLDIKRKGKEAREEALKYQKAVIGLEKELLEVIEPIEKDLKEKRTAIDEIKKMELRKKKLPERIERLKEIELEVANVELLGMDDKQFNEFFIEKKGEYLEAKEAKAKEEQEKKDAEIRKQQEEIAEQQRKIEEEKRIAEAKKQAEIEAKERVEREKQEAVEAEKRKAEAEKQKLIDEQNAKEQERLAEEARKKKEEDDRIAKEKADEEANKKKKEWIDFLGRNFIKPNEDYGDEIHIKKITQDNNKTKFILYKKADEIIL